MNISILTQPLGHNYGGLLQAYALQAYLKDIGCNVETLDRRSAESKMAGLRTTIIDLIRLASGRIRSFPTATKRDYAIRQLTEFRDAKIDLSPTITSELDLIEYYSGKQFDVVIVGSDQVWRPRYSPALLNFYLDFLDKSDSRAKRISYGASFGVNDWEYDRKTTAACKLLIKRFHAVSVREQSAVSLCQKYLGVTPALVVDPSMLLDIRDYQKLVSGASSRSKERRVLCYILDPAASVDHIVQEVSILLGKSARFIKPDKRPEQVKGRDIRECQYPRVEDWLQAFMGAPFVVTDSFHGCVFSILFNKPFIAIGNPNRGLARVTSLLSLFGLEERLVSNVQGLSYVVEQKIDWNHVNRIRRQCSEASKFFLRRNILGDKVGG